MSEEAFLQDLKNAMEGSGSGTTNRGNLTLTGLGAPQMFSGGKPISQTPDKVFSGSYSTSDINALFDTLLYRKDPRVTGFVNSYARGNTGVAREIWNDAAKYAMSLTRTGTNVNFFDLLNSDTFKKDYLKIPQSLLGGTGGASGPTTTYYITDYFKNGKPTAALQEKFAEELGKVLGHVPSAAEKKEYANVLTDMKKAQASGLFTASQTQGAGSSVSRPSADPTAWLATQLENKHQARVQYGKEGGQQSNVDNMQQIAHSYGVKITDANGNLTREAMKQLSLLESGKLTIDDIQNQFKVAALARYDYLKPQFDAGLTLQQIANPALNAIANVLEKDPNTISLDDTLVQKYLQGQDGKGVMPMYKYEALLRQDNSWQYTKNAHDTFSGLAMQIGQRFGMVG